jgi:hypothetical protein
MAEETKFCTSNVLQYLMYVALIALCLSGIVYLLMHARPQIAPQVKHDAASRLAPPSQRMHCSSPIAS